jgi:[ribosomal protein S18]-alanine N-acetyltransferase
MQRLIRVVKFNLMLNKKIRKDFIIRKYRNGDFEGIINLWTLTDLGNPARGDNEKTIEESIRIGGTFLVLEHKLTGAIAGTSWMTFDGRRIHLHHFGILPEYQGNGLAKILLDDSLAIVKKKGFQVKLEVHKTNTKAIELYEKAGFSYLGDYEVYIIRDIRKIKNRKDIT